MAQTFEQIKTMLDDLTLVDALWWFIENINADHPACTDTFFYLRERHRNQR